MEINMLNCSLYGKCELCPWKCECDRKNGKKGVCGVTEQLKVARAALHYWEEPCISGKAGSGTVFFSGCSLHCVFCQNNKIATGDVGKAIEPERLTEIFLELQAKGANNINLVTPGHYIPHIVYAVEGARRQGMSLPIVYNTSGYENVEIIKGLEGIVDVYLPDFKYFSRRLAAKYSRAENYPQVVQEAIAEMVRQQPNTYFYPEKEKENWKWYMENKIYEETEEHLLIGKGVIVRQLLLPGAVDDAQKIVKYLYQTYGNQIYVSLMSQFTPLKVLEEFPELMRKITVEEYDSLVDYAIELGIEHGFVQEGDVAEESFVPSFDCEGV